MFRVHLDNKEAIASRSKQRANTIRRSRPLCQCQHELAGGSSRPRKGRGQPDQNELGREALPAIPGRVNKGYIETSWRTL